MALDDEAATLPEIIRALDALGGGYYGFGRVDMIENRRVGIKSRELYEVAGALAHHPRTPGVGGPHDGA